MTVEELIKKLDLHDPKAKVQYKVVEPYDDKSAIYEEDVNHVYKD